MVAERRKRWIVGLLLLAALVGGGAAFLRKQTSELPVYVTGAARMLDGDPIYRRDEPKPFTYPPFFALPFVPFVVLPTQGQRVVWYVVNLAVLALVLSRLDRFWRGRVPDGTRVKFWLVTLLLAGRHVMSVFENQSHDLLVAALVVFAAVDYAERRELRAAGWAGIAAACKATPLLFLVLFVVQRRWRAALWMLGVALVLTGLPDLLLPQDGGKSWAVSWFDTLLVGIAPGSTAAVAGAWNAASYLNQSLSGTLHRLVTPVVEDGPFLRDVAVVALEPGARKVVILVGQLCVLGLVALAAMPRWLRGADERAAEQRRFAAAAAVTCGMVLLSPMSSKSHFCVLLLPIALAVADWLRPSKDRVVTLALVLLLLLGPLTVKGLIGGEIGEVVLAFGSVTACALVALLVVVRILTRASSVQGD